MASNGDVCDSLSSMKALPSVVMRSVLRFYWLGFSAAPVIPTALQKI